MSASPKIACALFWALACAVACKSQPERAHATASAAVLPPRPSAQAFGAKLADTGKTESVAAVIQHPEQFENRPVQVEGYVRRACSRRGCWLELAEGADPKLPGCRVTFKDYGFFVPTDSAGSTARVEASVQLAKLDPSYVAHIESEGATVPNKQPDGSAREVRLIASGVELWR